MPWKAISVMEEELRFILEYESDEYSMRRTLPALQHFPRRPGI